MVHPEAVTELAALPAPERVVVVNAFQLILQGANEDTMWSLATARARQDRMAAEREKRVWKF